MTTNLLLQKKEAFHYNRTHNHFIGSLCEPLKTYLNIEWFSRTIVALNSQQQAIGQHVIVTDIEFLDPYTLKLDSDVSGKPFAQAIKDGSLNSYSYLLWPNGNNCPLIEMCVQKIGLARGLTIYKRHQDHVMAWWFASKNENGIPSTVSQSSMAPFHEFIRYFEAKRAAHDLFSPLVEYALPFDLSYNEPDQQKMESFISSIQTRKFLFTIENQSIFLTKRELDCLSALSQGKTYKEVAVALSLSPRTVETYLNQIKEKTGTSYKSKLIDSFLKNNKEII